MFTQAKLKLTIVYSLFFLGMFWLLSAAIYGWTHQSLGQGYISQVREEHEKISPGGFTQTHTEIVTTAGEVALASLRRELLILNALLFLIVPEVAWVLAQKSFNPVEEAHARQRQFVSDASHELRTPLSVLTGELELSLTKTRPVKYYQHVIKDSLEEIKRLSQLVRDLLFFARQGKQLSDVNFSSVDLTDVTGRVISHLHQKSKMKHQQVKLIPDTLPSVIKGNPTFLEQLIYNLIQNAITYTPEKGLITVKLINKKQRVVVQVTDTGIGISKLNQTHIFDRFFRVDPSRGRRDGYGLGLAICKSIVDSHQGTIQVNSKLNSGTTFTVILPK